MISFGKVHDWSRALPGQLLAPIIDCDVETQSIPFLQICKSRRPVLIRRP